MSNIHKLPYTADEVERLLESVGNSVTYTPQTLTDEQKEQARKNIGAVDAKYVTPQMYGAKGDGVSDDTDAIRAARAAAIEEKKALYFPAGTYMVHGSIELWSDCEIYGDGSKTVIKKIAAVSDVLKPAGTKGSFVAGQNTFTVADGSKYTVGHDCYVGVNWQNVEGLCGRIESVNGNVVTVKTFPKNVDDSGLLIEGIQSALLVYYNHKNMTVVLSTSFPVFGSHSYKDDGSLNALHNVYIHDLSIDGNRQDGEAKPYFVSAIHFDELPNARSNGVMTVPSPHENIRLENLNISNSPSDGISVQSGKNVCVTNCITENCGYNGVHFGVGTVIGSVVGCKLNADFCGYFDCAGVSAVSLSNNHFESCLTGIGGLDSYTRGLTITGNTFRGCNVGVQAGSTKNPQTMLDEYPSKLYMGTPNTGITICNNTFYGVNLTGVGISFTVGSCFTSSGNTFRDLATAIEMGAISHVRVADNLIKDCGTALSMVEGDNADAPLTYHSAFVGNVIHAEADGASAAVTIAHAQNVLVSGNIVTGTGAAVTIEDGTTSGVIAENNIIMA